jgi:hypothetical protein
MRLFQIVSDRGLKDLIQVYLDIGKLFWSIDIWKVLLFFSGREFRSETHVLADDLLPSDRTVKNELDRLATYKRNSLKSLW